MTPRSGTTALGRQLLGAQVVVVAAMAVTVTGVAALLGPPAFESHMQQAGHEQPPLVLQHAQQAFQTAGIVALGAGIATAALGAILVQSVLARRLGTAVRELTDRLGPLAESLAVRIEQCRTAEELRVRIRDAERLLAGMMGEAAAVDYMRALRRR